MIFNWIISHIVEIFVGSVIAVVFTIALDVGVLSKEYSDNVQNIVETLQTIDQVVALIGIIVAILSGIGSFVKLVVHIRNKH